MNIPKTQATTSNHFISGYDSIAKVPRQLRFSRTETGERNKMKKRLILALILVALFTVSLIYASPVAGERVVSDGYGYGYSGR